MDSRDNAFRGLMFALACEVVAVLAIATLIALWVMLT